MLGSARPPRGRVLPLGHGNGLLAGNLDALKAVVRLDLLLHLLLDPREVLGRDAVGQLQIVIKAVLHRGTGGELSLGPDLQNGRGKHVGARMAQGLEFSHG